LYECRPLAWLAPLAHLPICNCAAGEVRIMMRTARRDCHALRRRFLSSRRASEESLTPRLRVGLVRRGNLNRVKKNTKGDIGKRTMKTIIFDFGNVVGFVDHRRGLEKLRPFTTLTPEAMLASGYDGDLEDRFERGHLTPLAFLEQAHQL